MAAVTEPRPPTPRACLAIALGAFVLRMALVLRPVVVLDRLFAPDDTYYTLAIARSIARGMGPTVDGIHLTSGFQPLLAFLLVPFLRCCEEPDFAFRSALAIGVCADAVTTWLIGHLAFRIGRGSVSAAIVASTTWALSSSAIAASLNGLESSLSVAVTVGALAMWMEARSRGTLLAWGLSGALLGLCLFTRVDTVFLVLVVGVATLLRAGIAATAASALGALATALPWWAYALARFGTFVPESGAAVREQTFVYSAMGINVRDRVAWAAGAVVGPPIFDSTWLREALGRGASAIGFALGVALVVGALVIARQSRRHDVVRMLTTYASCIFAFYSLYLPATWFFRRYLLPVHVVSGLAFALLVARVWDERRVRVWPARAVAAGVVLCVVAALVTIVRFATSTPPMTVDQGHHGAKGYREPARQVLAMAPSGAVIGSFQSGALGWFADGSRRDVVNLDGVVDGEAARAFREHRMAAFARARGVTHLADWDMNVRLFLERSGDPRISRASLQAIGNTEPQGARERFVLYSITWPDPR